MQRSQHMVEILEKRHPDVYNRRKLVPVFVFHEIRLPTSLLLSCVSSVFCCSSNPGVIPQTLVFFVFLMASACRFLYFRPSSSCCPLSLKTYPDSVVSLSTSLLRSARLCRQQGWDHKRPKSTVPWVGLPVHWRVARCQEVHRVSFILWLLGSQVQATIFTRSRGQREFPKAMG